MSNDECQGIPCFIEWGCGETPLFDRSNPSDLVSRTRTILLALDSADSLEGLKFPPDKHLEQLGGDRKGLHSLRINSQWRICFLWTEKGPADVEIVDYH